MNWLTEKWVYKKQNEDAQVEVERREVIPAHSYQLPLKLRVALLLLQYLEPSLYKVARHFLFVPTPNIGGIGADKWGRVYFEPSYLEVATPQWLAAMLAIFVLAHVLRTRFYAPRNNLALWNIVVAYSLYDILNACYPKLLKMVWGSQGSYWQVSLILHYSVTAAIWLYNGRSYRRHECTHISHFPTPLIWKLENRKDLEFISRVVSHDLSPWGTIPEGGKIFITDTEELTDFLKGRIGGDLPPFPTEWLDATLKADSLGNLEEFSQGNKRKGITSPWGGVIWGEEGIYSYRTGALYGGYGGLGSLSKYVHSWDMGYWLRHEYGDKGLQCVHPLIGWMGSVVGGGLAPWELDQWEAQTPNEFFEHEQMRAQKSLQMIVKDHYERHNRSSTTSHFTLDEIRFIKVLKTSKYGGSRDWALALQDFLDDSLGYGRGDNDYTLRIPSKRYWAWSRRYPNMPILPGMQEAERISEIVFILDVSGSMQYIISTVIEHVQEICEEYGVLTRVIGWNTALVYDYPQIPWDRIDRLCAAGGGTRLSPALKYALNKYPQANIYIFVSDLDDGEYYKLLDTVADFAMKHNLVVLGYNAVGSGMYQRVLGERYIEVIERRVLESR